MWTFCVLSTNLCTKNKSKTFFFLLGISSSHYQDYKHEYRCHKKGLEIFLRKKNTCVVERIRYLVGYVVSTFSDTLFVIPRFLSCTEIKLKESVVIVRVKAIFYCRKLSSFWLLKELNLLRSETHFSHENNLKWLILWLNIKPVRWI